MGKLPVLKCLFHRCLENVNVYFSWERWWLKAWTLESGRLVCEWQLYNLLTLQKWPFCLSLSFFIYKMGIIMSPCRVFTMFKRVIIDQTLLQMPRNMKYSINDRYSYYLYRLSHSFVQLSLIPPTHYMPGVMLVMM